ncbi:MAG: HD domain-containing protein [Oscillibacter sp.]|nr:HD domain-containing protein [Oscillibacter sp.]
MENTENFTDIRSLLGALAQAMNLINTNLEDHHQRTAYLAFHIAREMGLPDDQVYLCGYAALLHDVGSILSDEPQEVAEIERNARRMATVGAMMLRGLPDFHRVADVIQNCQCSWLSVQHCGNLLPEAQQKLLPCAGVVYLADRVCAVLNPHTPVLTQARKIRQTVASCRGTVFCPDASDAFLRVSEWEYLWLDALYNPQFLAYFTGEIQNLSLERTAVLTRLMSRIIDFRSRFTAMHSAGVAASAKALAQLAGMSREECLMMEIAGNLHDAGKLKVPRSILEKPGPLDKEEFDVMREHPYNTALVLLHVRGFERIGVWASRHHEKLNGSGYPFHDTAEDLDTGSRIMAIADIFSAITEDRPYRAGMPREESMAVLRRGVADGGLDADLVELLCSHYDGINDIRAEASKSVVRHYRDSFRREEELWENAAARGDAEQEKAG